MFAAGALPEKTKQRIVVAVAHTTQCPYCIHWHTRGAPRTGATQEEIMEATRGASEMRVGNGGDIEQRQPRPRELGAVQARPRAARRDVIGQAHEPDARTGTTKYRWYGSAAAART
ncbi:MAG TPA: carboxymuconolactone decarboxylase family protein [Gammaproteobacteria bacterium]|nr:carboxymuconolactone decarboxylase family protein [Gammaproteobacteria bacterium]